jgi:hypothetical protein
VSVRLTVWLSVTRNRVVGLFYSDLPVWLPFGFGTVIPNSPPMGTGIQIIPDSESFPGIRVWDPQFPPNGYRYPNHPRLRIIPGIPDSLTGRRGSQTPVCPRVWDSLGYWIRGYSSRILNFVIYHSIKMSTTEIQNTRLKLAKPFRLQIQFWKLIQFFSLLLCTNILLVQSIWLRNEAYILFCWCVAWSIIDTMLTPIQYDTIHCHFFRITLNTDTKWVS